MEESKSQRTDFIAVQKTSLKIVRQGSNTVKMPFWKLENNSHKRLVKTETLLGKGNNEATLVINLSNEQCNGGLK